MVQDIEKAVLQTLIYADVFQFPMTPHEIHRFLIHDTPVSFPTIADTLASSVTLAHFLHFEQGYISLKESKHTIKTRLKREHLAEHLFPDAVRYGAYFGYLPFVEMVAMTGALAMRNPSDTDDDYDYILVVKPGRVWLTRAFAIFIVRLARLWGKNLCPNFVLGRNELLQVRQDLYMAHEVTQMVPIYGGDLYKEMCRINDWTYHYLPNANPKERSAKFGNGRIGKWLKFIGEWIFGTRIGNWLESWEYRRKHQRFAKQATEQPHSSAQIDEHQVKGHFEDHGYPVLKQYQERLQEYELQSFPMSVAGD